MIGILQDTVQIKTVNTKFGAKPIWGVVIDGATYEVGFKKPRFESGSEVEFDTEFKYGQHKILEGTLRLQGTPAMSAAPKPAAPSAPPASPSAYPSRGSRVFPIPPNSGEIAIIRQNALTNAREVLCQMGPSYFGRSKAEMATMKDTVSAIVEMAKEFEKYTSGQE